MNKSSGINTDYEFRPFSESLLSDPYPFYRHWREHAPVFYSGELDYWVVCKYEHIRKILRDYETFSAENTISPIQSLSERTGEILKSEGWNLVTALGNADRPEHTKNRKNVVKAFTPKRVDSLAPLIREVVNTRVDRIQDRGYSDLMSDLVFDLPALDMLGFSQDEVADIKEGARNRVLFIWGRTQGKEQEDLARNMAKFFKDCRRLVEKREAALTDDLTSDLLRVRDGDDSIFTRDLIASILFAFFTAGHETTSGQLGNTIRRLLAHGRAWNEICNDPALIPNAVEEILRFDSTVVSWRRRARKPFEIEGTVIPEGADILLLLGSANHDEDTFENPDSLDIHRENAKEHLSFGSGIHHCLGASLARKEIQITLEILTKRLPNMRLVENQRFEYLPNIAFRGLRNLKVEWSK